MPRKKKKRQSKKTISTYIWSKLRAVWGWSEHRKIAKKRPDKCERCKEVKTGYRPYVIHHKVPVEWGLDWHERIKLLFCHNRWLVKICKDCHKLEHQELNEVSEGERERKKSKVIKEVSWV